MEWTHWINHELKTPLNRMESLLMTLEKREACGFEEQRLIMMMKDSLNDCRTTLDSLYLYNKIQVKKIHPKFQQTDINRVVLQAVQDAKPLSGLKGLNVSVEAEPIFPMYVDEQLFKRAFLNILENAIKFSPPESKILVSVEVVKQSLIVQVSDQGVGMEEAQLEKIFDPYFRVEETAHKPGSGLGLYIAKSFVEHHGGSIEVDSVKSMGSTFTISLPKERFEASSS